MEGGFEEEAVGRGGEEGLAGKRELEVAVEFEERRLLLLAGVGIEGEVRGAEDAGLDDLAVRLAEVERLAFEASEQPVLVDDGGVVVLLGDVDGGAARRVAEDDGVGLELAGDGGGGDVREAGCEAEVDRGADDGEVVVVNGELAVRDGALLGGGGGEQDQRAEKSGSRDVHRYLQAELWIGSRRGV